MQVIIEKYQKYIRENYKDEKYYYYDFKSSIMSSALNIEKYRNWDESVYQSKQAAFWEKVNQEYYIKNFINKGIANGSELSLKMFHGLSQKDTQEYLSYVKENLIKNKSSYYMLLIKHFKYNVYLLDELLKEKDFFKNFIINNIDKLAERAKNINFLMKEIPYIKKGIVFNKIIKLSSSDFKEELSALEEANFSPAMLRLRKKKRGESWKKVNEDIEDNKNIEIFNLSHKLNKENPIYMHLFTFEIPKKILQEKGFMKMNTSFYDNQKMNLHIGKIAFNITPEKDDIVFTVKYDPERDNKAEIKSDIILIYLKSLNDLKHNFEKIEGKVEYQKIFTENFNEAHEFISKKREFFLKEKFKKNSSENENLKISRKKV